MADVWRSSRLIYRACEDDDEDFLFETTQDSQSYVNSAPFLPVPQGKEAAKGSVKWMKSCLLAAIVCIPADEAALAAATEKEPAKPKPIGYISLMGNDKFQHHRHSMIGLGFLPQYHGQGYGTESIKWVLSWAFRFGNLHRVEIGVFSWNPRALKLYEKLGFVLEGRKREHMWYDGEYRDVIELAMLEKEWRALYGQTKPQMLDGDVSGAIAN